MATSLNAILGELRPKRALFTTFTLSLSYFEAAFLPLLRQSDCREIAILADAEGLAMSMAEARTAGVGRTYRLCSVKAPGGGIFHPKLAYLKGEHDDVLVV